VHELGLAHGIFDIVRTYVPEPQAPLVRGVRVAVGPRANVIPESLEFCFGAIVHDTAYAKAFLACAPGTDDLRVIDIELEDPS